MSSDFFNGFYGAGSGGGHHEHASNTDPITPADLDTELQMSSFTEYGIYVHNMYIWLHCLHLQLYC